MLHFFSNDSPAWSLRKLVARMGGAWLEPRPGYMWQENTGLTPTTAAGQTVGLLLDQSQGMVLGQELVANGTFTADISGWTQSGAGVISQDAGRLKIVANPGGRCGAYCTLNPLESGTTYELGFTVTGGGCWVAVGAIPTNGEVLFRGDTGVGSKSFKFLASSATLYLFLNTASSGSTIFLDNVSVRKILGNHGSQATATARPLLQSSPNRLAFQADDSLVVTTPSALGTNCTVALGVAGGEPIILTGQTIGTSYTVGLSVMSITALVIFNGPLSAADTNRLIRYLRLLG
jgi:hypothetical protein